MRLNPNKTQSMIVSRSRTVFPPHPDLLVGSTSLNSCDFLKFSVLCLTVSLLLRGTFVPFLPQLLKRLVYLENLLESLGIMMSYCNASTLLFFLVWSIVPLFGPLQLIPILNSLIGIYKLVNFWFQMLQLVCSTVGSIVHCVCFTRSFITLPILSILNFPICSVPGESREVPWVLIVYLSHLWGFILLSIPDVSFQLQPKYKMNFPAWLWRLQSCKNLSLVLMPFYWMWMDCSLLYVPQFFIYFLFCWLFI